jgi:alpha-galactosidase
MKLPHRKLSRRLAILAPLSLVLLFTLGLASQTDLTGFWVFRVPTGDGNFRESFFDLKQEGENISGKAILGPREVALSEGSLRDGKLHFVVSFTAGNPPQTRTTTYDGTLEGDKITITSTAPNREPITGTLERSRPEAALPPPRLPLPELRDLPDNGLARTPPMGWNSWNLFACRGVNDAVVRGIADAMVSSGMKAAGYEFVNIDDCWEGPKRGFGFSVFDLWACVLRLVRGSWLLEAGS